jgi:hypothetical protein
MKNVPTTTQARDHAPKAVVWRKIPYPTAEEINRFLDYDPTTGVFTRRGTKMVAGSITRQGHLIIRVGDRVYLAHRLAWIALYGEEPSRSIKHKNGNRADNRASNLRLTNPKLTKTPRVSNSGVRGVYYHFTGKWQASVTINGRRHYLGLFPTIAEASSTVERVRAAGVVPSKKPKANASGYVGVYWVKSAQNWCAQAYIGRKRFNLGRFTDKEEAARRVQYARENPDAILIEKGYK